MWIEYNANPDGRRTNDCTIRAICKLTGKSWDEIHCDTFVVAHAMRDMQEANRVWGRYLRMNGYKRHALPDDCPDCYTVREFCADHPHGKYMLALDGHVVAVEDGNYYDTWDSGNETAIYYWKKEV